MTHPGAVASSRVRRVRARREVRLALLALLAVCAGAVASCASAGKRLEQGVELEAQGRYDEAVYRYVEALEKDADLVEARDRLLAAGDSAVTLHLSDAEGWAAGGDPVRAAEHVLRVDDLLARARTVRVRLPTPADYTQRRRGALDAALEYHLDYADGAAASGRYDDAVSAYRQARGPYDPSPAQRDRSLTGESEALLAWSRSELERGSLRTAYDLANRAGELGGAPREVQAEAEDVMAYALERGEVELMPLPVIPGGRRREVAALDVSALLDRTLATGAWRAPPPFVRITEDRLVREVVGEASALGAGLTPRGLALLLRLTDADYGAWVEVLSVDAVEFDVDRDTRSARTREGEATTYVVESGSRRLRSEVRLVVVDREGVAIEDAVLIGTGTGRFRRALYDGDPRGLDLGRREVDYFDPAVLRAQEEAVRQALAADLAARVAGAAYGLVLERVP
ncbi:MAG: hypothetical protein RQ751_05035 [Longimicrobiales bacterium]|nr:hypothetical protein [Longimicrobiales bacterium]